MVGIWLLCEESSSSQVTISRLLWVLAHFAYALMLLESQVSPCAMVPSCMSSFRFGITHETVGSEAKLDELGKLVNGRLSEAGTLLKLVHGTCLRAYAPEVQAVEP